MRDNALQQAALLVEYKRIICHHPSHRRFQKASHEGGILSIFVSLLAEPLSRTGNARTDADHLTIELVLHLFRNLLAAEPLVKTPGSEDLHYELVSLLERELVLEILLVLAADIEQRENAPYNLLLMELLHLLLRHQNAAQVAKSSLPPTMVDRSRSAHSSVGGGARSGSSSTASSGGSLLGALRREKQALVANATSRHSHFGGTLQLESSMASHSFGQCWTLGPSSIPQCNGSNGRGLVVARTDAAQVQVCRTVYRSVDQPSNARRWQQCAESSGQARRCDIAHVLSTLCGHLLRSSNEEHQERVSSRFSAAGKW
jgi:Timeless protein